MNIIPTPKLLETSNGTTILKPCINTAFSPWQEYANTFCTSYKKMHRKDAAIAHGGIELVYDKSLKDDEYKIEIDDKVTAFASTDNGILYAIASLLQIVTPLDNGMQFEKGKICDYPDKDYRALMIDLAREWHPFYTLLNYVDVCYLLKLKYLHLHFIDNQSYTLPSKAFPKLSTKERYYTFEQIAELCDYAKARGITLIPEFEAPGHAMSITTAYPEVFANEMDGGEIPELTTEMGIKMRPASVVCAGSEQTLEAIKTLLQEICEMFPDSPYIHIGGDEANYNVWDYCETCREYMKQNGIKNSLELYGDFVARVSQAVIDMGRTPIVWEGFSKEAAKRINKKTIVIAWESHYNLAPDLLADGFKIINCSWQPLYFVPHPRLRWGYKEILNWNVYNWQHWVDMSPAKLNPINVAPTDNVIGAGTCIWEATYECEISHAIEKSAALSERVWNVERKLDDLEFSRRLKVLMKLIPRHIQQW